ncbi:MAG: MgtC/SapB family protein [Methanocella sp.]
MFDVPAVRLLGALVLGGVIGAEREIHGRPAGLRTHILVSLGSALFTLISLEGFVGAEPSRVAAQVVTGVGFLGAGTIMHDGVTIRGLTTAASLWVSAAIGLAVAVGRWPEAVFTTAFAFLTLWVLPVLERYLNGSGARSDETGNTQATGVPTDVV